MTNQHTREWRTAMLGLGVVSMLGLFGIAYAARDDEGCRVQVLTSEERIRDAVAVANKAYGDKIAVLIRELKVAP